MNTIVISYRRQDSRDPARMLLERLLHYFPGRVVLGLEGLLPGENVEIDIIRVGKENHQGVGYLDDGTMLVVEDGYRHIGERVKVTVTSMLQTSAGRMVFGRIKV